MKINSKKIKADVMAAEDRGESIAIMEPLLVRASSGRRETLADLALELAAVSTGLRRSLPDGANNGFLRR
jgi:hypothetical protein